MELNVLNADQAAASAEGCSASACGSSNDQMSHLPDSIREKVQNHPCYSEEAHHYFARMHVAVALKVHQLRITSATLVHLSRSEHYENLVLVS